MAQPFEVDAGQKHGPGGVDENEFQLASPFRSLVSGHLRSRAVRLDSHEPLMIRSEARTGGPFPGRSVRHARCERMRPLACSEPLDDRFGPVGQSDTIVLSGLARVQAAPRRPNSPNDVADIRHREPRAPAEGTVTGTDETPQAARSRGVFAAR
jgi:hypothetical protein